MLEAHRTGKASSAKHRTTESDSFWEDVGHADVATGRGVLSLRSFFVGASRLRFKMPNHLF
ncbi:hypothetical protein ABE26_05120 [Cytobacillus firmus]|nr:hypothetical protein [Cytobacillus firmus]